MPYASFNRLELRITRADAAIGSHSGACDGDIAYLRCERKYIARQLAALDPDTLRDELREYGAWDAGQLADHDANLIRILWIACGDITENI